MRCDFLVLALLLQEPTLVNHAVQHKSPWILISDFSSPFPAELSPGLIYLRHIIIYVDDIFLVDSGTWDSGRFQHVYEPSQLSQAT